MTRPRIAVVGWGVKAPGGCCLDELWSSLCAGRHTAQPYVDERLPPGTDLLVSLVEGFEPSRYLSSSEVRRLDRAHHLGIAAAQDAIDGVTAPLPAPDRCAVVCGVGLGAADTYEAQHARLLSGGLRALNPLVVPIVMPSAMAALLSLRFGFRGPVHTLNTACASGASAIGEGAELLHRGAADLVLAGGVDSMVTFNALCGFERLGVLSRNVARPDLASRPFDVDRDGFVMGEGAGFVVLQRAADAQTAGNRVLGTVAGYGTCADGFHLVAPHPDGEGALRCMQLALADAGVNPGEVSHVNAHGTSTVANDRAEAAALAALFPRGTPPVTAVKGTTGHLIGGSGAVEALVTWRSLHAGVVPPVAGLRTVDPEFSVDVVAREPRAIGPGYGLTSSFGFGGSNACLVLAPD